MIAGGLCLWRRVQGAPEEIYPRIGPTFEEMASSAYPDEERPWIEFYRRRDDVVLLLPALEQGS